MDTRLVALHMTLNTNHRLEIAQGVVQYAREHPEWRLFGSFYTSQPVLNYGEWEGDGIISICHRKKDAREILATGLPIVDVVEGFFDERLDYVACDNDMAGRMAGAHLAATGYVNFAYCDVRGLRWSDLRLRGFCEEVGVEATAMPVFSRNLGWWQNSLRSVALERFLRSLPARTALLCGNDTVGVKVTAGCQHVGRKIPDDIAVLGIEGDNLLCELSFPPLSTIPINGMKIGFEAAKRLDELMRTSSMKRERLLIPPDKVIVRSSSEIMVCEDPTVRRALIYIRNNFRRVISTDDVAKAVAVCRRTLEYKFKAHMQRTVLEEIHENRMRAVCGMLEETDLPIHKIRFGCGFMSHQNFYQLFKKKTGMSPIRYREKARGKEQ